MIQARDRSTTQRQGRITNPMASFGRQISRTVRELEGLGLIERTPDPDDGRSSLLSPTPFGLERLEAARAPQESLLVDALEEWPLDDILNLTRLLHALTADELPGS